MLRTACIWRACLYRMSEAIDVIYMIHTIVPESLRGHKIGEVLVEEALTICREKNWEVVPLCPFVLAFIKAHPEFQSLVPAQHHTKYFE